MSIIKNVSGPYTINTINHDDPIILDSNVVIINGNLTVLGNTTTISSTNTEVYDNIINLNAGVTGVPTLNAGLQINRGDSDDVQIRWREDWRVWQLTNDGTAFGNITTFSGNGVNIQRVEDDKNPVLGGNLYTNLFAITSNTTVYIAPEGPGVQFDSNLQIKKYGTAPDIVSGYNILHAANVGQGGSGVFVTADTNTSAQELITKNRAIVYSIIF